MGLVLRDLFVGFSDRHQRRGSVPRRQIGDEDSGLHRRIGLDELFCFFERRDG